MLNAFVDAGMTTLSRVEIVAWLVLYRDTREGHRFVSMKTWTPDGVNLEVCGRW